jgi:hypothetical protein
MVEGDRRDVTGGADGRDTELPLGGVLLGVLDDLGDRLLGHLRGHDHHHRGLADPRDVGEVGDRIERNLAHDLTCHDVGRCREQQRVAVRLRLEDTIGTNGPVGPGPVLDHHSDAALLLDLLAEQAGKGIDTATGGEGHDDLDRVGRILGRLGEHTVHPRDRDQTGQEGFQECASSLD